MPKHIDIAEFRDIGFVYEGNRQFFHPHGLALEITIVDSEGWTEDNERVKMMAEAIMSRMYGTLVDVDAAAEADMRRECVELAIAAMMAIYPPGSQHISGVWDYRDDKEGIIFGEATEDGEQKAARVLAERERHRAFRSALFDREGEIDSDIEPLGWTITEEQIKELNNS